MISLVLLASGVNAALDRLSQSPAENSYTFYNEKGQVLLSYSGDLSLCPMCAKPSLVGTSSSLHRT